MACGRSQKLTAETQRSSWTQMNADICGSMAPTAQSKLQLTKPGDPGQWGLFRHCAKLRSCSTGDVRAPFLFPSPCIIGCRQTRGNPADGCQSRSVENPWPAWLSFECSWVIISIELIELKEGSSCFRNWLRSKSRTLHLPIQIDTTHFSKGSISWKPI